MPSAVQYQVARASPTARRIVGLTVMLDHLLVEEVEVDLWPDDLQRPSEYHDSIHVRSGHLTTEPVPSLVPHRDDMVEAAP